MYVYNEAKLYFKATTCKEHAACKFNYIAVYEGIM